MNGATGSQSIRRGKQPVTLRFPACMVGRTLNWNDFKMCEEGKLRSSQMGHTELKTRQNDCVVRARCARRIEFHSDCPWHRSSFTSVHTFRQDNIQDLVTVLINLSTTDNNIKCQKIQISITYTKISNILNHIKYQMQKSNIKYKKSNTKNKYQ